MVRTRLISAICTPLREDQSLHPEGLEAHIEDQVDGGIDGLLVAGTMGLLQLLSDQTYKDLISRSIQLNQGRCELLVGVGDASYARTLDRIRYVEQFECDAVVIITPSFIKFSEDDLELYFRKLADASRKPLFLYDLPQLTGIHLGLEFVKRVTEHPNIAGIKCSGPWEDTEKLIAQIGERIRVIPAQPLCIPDMIRAGVRDNLDGIYSVFPRYTRSIADAADQGNWEVAQDRQTAFCKMLKTVGEYSVFPSCNELFKARQIECKVAPLPMQPLSDERRQSLLREPSVSQVLAEELALTHTP